MHLHQSSWQECSDRRRISSYHIKPLYPVSSAFFSLFCIIFVSISNMFVGSLGVFGWAAALRLCPFFFPSLNICQRAQPQQRHFEGVSQLDLKHIDFYVKCTA